MIYEKLSFEGINIRKNASHIIICDTKTEKIDIVAFHNYCISNKRLHGIPYHYVITRDGEIHNTKPINYSFEMYKSLNDDIVIAMEGDSDLLAITVEQRVSLIGLVGDLLDKECLAYSAVKILSDFVGGDNPGTKTDWKGIVKTIVDNWVSVDKNRIPVANISMDSVDGSTVDSIGFHTLKKGEDVGRIAYSVGTTPQHLSAPSNLTNKARRSVGEDTPLPPGVVIPGTSLLFKNNVVAQGNYIADEHSTISNLLSEIINNKTYTYQAMYEAQQQQINKTLSAKVSLRNSYEYSVSGRDIIPAWCNDEMKVPGYSRCNIIFTDMITGTMTTMPFIVSPSSFAENRSTQQQMSKTTAGWFVMRLGQQFTTIQLTGYMLDTDKIHERQSFIIAYNTFIRDTKDDFHQYQNRFKATLNIEGRSYTGLVQSISLSKSALQQFLYQYNITFLALSETSPFDSSAQSLALQYGATKVSTYAARMGKSFFTNLVANLGTTVYNSLNNVG